jgi:hypothetical protein
LARSTELLPLVYPSHALLLVGFGSFFWAFGKLVRLAAKNKDQLTEYSKYNPWFIYFKGRPMTVEEAKRNLPSVFWKLYDLGGRLAQGIGIVIVSVGFLSFVIAIIKKSLA